VTQRSYKSKKREVRPKRRRRAGEKGGRPKGILEGGRISPRTIWNPGFLETNQRVGDTEPPHRELSSETDGERRPGSKREDLTVSAAQLSNGGVLSAKRRKGEFQNESRVSKQRKKEKPNRKSFKTLHEEREEIGGKKNNRG